MQLFSLKLLDLLVSRNVDFARQIKANDEVLKSICDFYMIKNSNLNRHTINLIRVLTEQKLFSHEELQQFKIIEKTHLILKNMMQNEQNEQIEPLLEIIHTFLGDFNNQVKQNEASVVWACDSLFSNFDFVVQLLS